MRKQVAMGTALVVIIGLAIGVWAWTSGGRKKQAAADTAAVAVPVEMRDLSEKIEGTGSVASSWNGDIYPAYEATVQQIVRSAGDRVKKGDLLMVLDSSTLAEQWASAASNVNKAKLNLSQAEEELTLVQTLFKAQGATVDEVNSAKKQVALNQEELNLAQVNLDELREKPDGANFYSAGQRKLEIRAPFDGEVAWVKVKPGDKVTTSTLLLNLTSSQAMEITVSVDESEIGQVKAGQRALVSLNDADQTQVAGVVTRVGSTGAEESGVVVFPVTIQVQPVQAQGTAQEGQGQRMVWAQGQSQAQGQRRARGQSQGQTTVQLKPGMSADVTIYVSSTGRVLAIPASAVVQQQGQTMVQVPDPENPKTPKLVQVTLGTKSGSYVEVVSGLQEGDRVLIRRTGSGNWPGNGQQQGNRQGNSQGNRPPSGGTVMRFGVGGGH